jgi:hypothetical protein
MLQRTALDTGHTTRADHIRNQRNIAPFYANLGLPLCQQC